jgi:hypothetical protein
MSSVESSEEVPIKSKLHASETTSLAITSNYEMPIPMLALLISSEVLYWLKFACHICPPSVEVLE